MIEETTVLVIEHDQEALLPDVLIGTERIIGIGDQVLTETNVVWGVLVVRLCLGRLHREACEMSQPLEEVENA